MRNRKCSIVCAQESFNPAVLVKRNPSEATCPAMANSRFLIFIPGEYLDGLTIDALLGVLESGGHLYRASHDAINRDGSVVVYSFHGVAHSARWGSWKRSMLTGMELLGKGNPHLVQINDIKPISLPDAGQPELFTYILPLVIERVSAVNLSVALDAEHGKARIAQLIGSVSSIHSAGLAHGQLSPDSWWMGEDGLKLVDMGGLTLHSGDGDLAAQLMTERDVRTLADICLDVLKVSTGPTPFELRDILLEAACPGIGGRVHSAVELEQRTSELLRHPTTSVSASKPPTQGLERVEALQRNLTDTFNIMRAVVTRGGQK